MIDRSDAPAIAALVACPARSEWPAYFAASRPARSASFFTTRATSIRDNRPGCTCPCRLIDRNSGPALIAATFDPRLNRANRARLGIRSVRDADLAARALLIGLGPPQRDRQAILAERAILDVQCDQFRPAERAREPEQDQRPVARADQCPRPWRPPWRGCRRSAWGPSAPAPSPSCAGCPSWCSRRCRWAWASRGPRLCALRRSRSVAAECCPTFNRPAHSAI